ncbi:hypothetical protein ES708_27541 [subsurface metagenome]
MAGKALAPTKHLTSQERIFIAEYTVSYNGSKAAHLAWPIHKLPAQKAYQVLQRPHIQAALQKKVRKVIDKIEGSPEEALKMVRDIAVIDKKDYVKKRISRGIELYGKSQGIFIDKLDATHRLGESEMSIAARIAQEQGESEGDG